MQAKEYGEFDKDWSEIVKRLPAGWEEQARAKGALKFGRSFPNPEVLLRVLLIYLTTGCSMRETVVRAREAGLAKVSDVALLKRINRCGEWLRWMSEQLMASLPRSPCPMLAGHRLLAVDGSVVQEPGGRGCVRLHYALDLASLRCHEVQITRGTGGETLTRFSVQPGDVVIADRGFANRRGISHVLELGGQVLVRMNLVSVPLENEQGQAFEQLPYLRSLQPGQTGQWRAVMQGKHGPVAVRVCAYRKTEAQRQESERKYHKYVSKKQQPLQTDTLEATGYVVVLTTLEELDAGQVMGLYRHRWQVELAFKRLKSLLGLGHLKKQDKQGGEAWLQGKLFVACLIEHLIALGDRFSPRQTA